MTKTYHIFQPWRLLVFAVCAALLLPALFMDGMFMDGQIYATVSHNLATGHGSFWEPVFSGTYMSSYHEQPPLLFGIESFFFRLLGDSLYTERIYCLVTALLTAGGIMRTWRLLHTHNSLLRGTDMLPVLLWFIMPVSFWAYINHVEEGTMVVFTLLSAEFQLRALLEKKPVAGWLVAAGIAALAAGMCKGVQGMFVIAFAPLFAIVTREVSIKRGFIAGLVVTLTAAAIFGLLWTQENVRTSFARYYHDRILATFSVHDTATTGNHFFLLWELLLNLAGPLLIAAICLWRFRPASWRRIVFFFITGLSGTLPLLVTKEQRGFYLVTTLPFYAIALSLICENAVTKFLLRFGKQRWPAIAAGIVFSAVIVVTVMQAGKPKRDADTLHDVYLIGPVMGNAGVAAVSPEVFRQYAFQAYLARHYHIGLSTNTDARWFITEHGKAAPEGYSKKNLPLTKFDLWEK